MLFRKLQIFFILFTLLALGNSANAAIEFPFEINYPGANCRPMNPAHDTCTTIDDYFGWMGNSCVYDVWVICPANETKYLMGYSLTQITSTTIWYKDDSSQSFECDIVARDSNSTGYSFEPIDPPDKNSQTIYSITDNTNVSYWDSYSPIYLRCKIPRYDGYGGISWLVGYTLRMNSGDV